MLFINSWDLSSRKENCKNKFTVAQTHTRVSTAVMLYLYAVCTSCEFCGCSGFEVTLVAYLQLFFIDKAFHLYSQIRARWRHIRFWLLTEKKHFYTPHNSMFVLKYLINRAMQQPNFYRSDSSTLTLEKQTYLSPVISEKNEVSGSDEKVKSKVSLTSFCTLFLPCEDIHSWSPSKSSNQIQ